MLPLETLHKLLEELILSPEVLAGVLLLGWPGRLFGFAIDLIVANSKECR